MPAYPINNSIVEGCHWFFIEVNEGGRFDFVTAFKPKFLTQKAYVAIGCTYNCSAVGCCQN